MTKIVGDTIFLARKLLDFGIHILHNLAQYSIGNVKLKQNY